jgi:hypothetical protein
MSTDANYQLAFGAAATAVVKSLLSASVKPHLHDVRAMLRLPLEAEGITAGCNFAAVHVLLNLLSGLSRLMGPGPAQSGTHFKVFVRKRYPWSMEQGGLSPYRATEALYNQFRNGFAHDLGLALEKVMTSRPNKKQRVRLRFQLRDPRIAVSKAPSLSPDQLVALDDVKSRPFWLRPTVRTDTGQDVVLDAVALYWGVRRLIFDHTNDRESMRSLVHMIDRTMSRRRRAGLIQMIRV